MWDFVVLKHGHENSRGVLISMILIMSSTLQRTLNPSSICKKSVKCCEVTLCFNHVGAYFKMNVAP